MPAPAPVAASPILAPAPAPVASPSVAPMPARSSMAAAAPAAVSAPARPLRSTDAAASPASSDGIGALEALLADDSVEEIQVSRHDRINVVRAGRAPESASASFADDAALARALVRLCELGGREASGALLDTRLGGGPGSGWRVVGAVPPASRLATCVLSRDRRSATPPLDELVRRGGIPGQAADWLARSLAAGRVVAVSGQGSARAAVLGALGQTLPADARVVSVEDAAELSLPHAGWSALEVLQSGELRSDAVAQTLAVARRLRPDRLVLGALRADDGLAVLDALSGAPPGTLLALDGDSTRDALLRLERAARRRAGDGATYAIREQIAQAVHILVQVTTAAGGVKVTQISEMLGLDQQGYSLRDLPL
jgi:pilus assembly protein CpaF